MDQPKRRGRPKLSSPEQRKWGVNLRFNPEDERDIRAIAAAEHLAIGALLRRWIAAGLDAALREEERAACS